ncbi:zona pellucida sperm-binding protein 3-like [Hemicordylus capensis]|uniref:zona pellucida sperm-binding protein 3-like n=1 Tax=Hemicordylus capensis TaxID=884348 RepID=UPI0023035F06|nr:zona pellucida sperm-binding protein 3-like [Hemicordylus capensis]
MGLRAGLVTVLAWSLLVASAAAQRVPVNPVFYECDRTSIHLVVGLDPWGTGLRLDPQSLHLGNCPPSSENSPQSLLHFQYSLKECGFARLATGNTVEYSASLVYRPPSGRGRFYNRPFSERINCTSHEAQRSTPAAPVSSTSGQLSASSAPMFTVTLMNEDFSRPLDSTIFLLGSQIYIELAVQRAFHQPLQVFVDECVAATTPELNTSPRNYSIITNHGCFVDGKVSNSQFLPRQTPETLRLSLQAFGFVGVDTDIYLHCWVLVWDPNVRTDPTKKACSFLRETQRWQLLDDPSSALCSCCDSVCHGAGSRPRRDLPGYSAEGGPRYNVVVGHLKIQKSAPNAGSYEWDSNSSLAVRSHKGGKQNVMRPAAVGALLLELAVVAALSLGFCVYNGYQKRLWLPGRGTGDPATQGLVNAEQDCRSSNAGVEEPE